MKILIGSALIFFSLVANAECYLVGKLDGYQTSKSNDYAFVSSSFSGQEFQINIDGPRSYAAPQGKEKCSEFNRNGIICSLMEGSKSKYEIWSLDLNRNVVVFSGHRAGYDIDVDGDVVSLDGAYVFTGKILGKCK